MACTLSTMSCKRRRGFSEGKSAIPVDLFLQALFAHRLFDYIHLAGEDCRQPVLEVLYAAEVVEAGLGEALAQAHSHIDIRSEEHTSELQSLRHLVCRLLLEKK